MVDERYLTYGEGLSSLNPEQVSAVCHLTGPCLVLAGPGSGKTLVLIRRLHHLISENHISPSSILTITFTRAASEELRSRANDLLSDRASGITFGTFHSVFYKILKHTYRLSSDNIIKPSRKKELILDAARSLKIELCDGIRTVNGLINEISRMKCGLKESEFESAYLDREQFFALLDRYKARMKDMRLLDFDDMLLFSLDLFKERPAVLNRWKEKFKYIQVDEFQDVDHIQYELLKLLSGDDGNLFVVGDDDQSIYGFRGSDPKILLGFPQDFPGTEIIRLSVNYRSAPGIVDAAGRVISENEVRMHKDIVSGSDGASTDGAPDIREFLTREDEILCFRDLIKESGNYNDTALLLRTNELSSFYAERLSSLDIPVKIREQIVNIYDHFIARDILSCLSFASGDQRRDLFYRFMNRPFRGISRNSVGSETVDLSEVLKYHMGDIRTRREILRLQNDLRLLSGMRPYPAVHYLLNGMGYERFLKELAMEKNLDLSDLFKTVSEIKERARGYRSLHSWKKDIEDFSLLAESLNRRDDCDRDGVNILTLHSSKGLEFEEVFIFDVNESLIPYHKSSLKEEIEEERRLFYVGMTRAKKKLHLWYIRDNLGKAMEPSSFLRPLFPSRP